MKKSLILLLILTWLLSGWPPLWQTPRFPPKIEDVHAAPPIPSYRASGTFTSGTGAITPPYPASMQAGDVCLLVAESENQAISLSSPQGFVQVTNSPQASGTGGTDPANRIAIFWKKTAGGDTAPTLADSGNHTTGQIHCFLNVIASGNPWDITAGGTDGGANDTSGVVPGETTTIANTLIVLIEGSSNNGTSTAQCSGWTNASLTNLTERTDNTNTAGLGGGHCMATGEKATAGAYSNTTVTMAVTTFKGAMSIALKPVTPTYTQAAYRLFNNTDATDVGTALAAQDTAATLPTTSASFRVRMLLRIDTDQLPASGEDFKLQFAQQSGTCDTAFSGETYADVTTSSAISYKDNTTPADWTALTANANDPTDGARTIVNQAYEEANNATNSQSAIPSGQDGKWDFSLFDNGAAANTTYCLRLIKSDGATLNTYTVIPQISTAAATITSVTLTTDGTVAYGLLAAGANKDTTPTGLNDTQTAKNDGNVTENFNIKTSNATGGTQWTLGASAGNDTFVHEFSTNGGGAWTQFTTADSYQTLASGIAVNGTQNVDVRITVPTSSSDFQQKSITVTIQAVAQ